MKITGEELVRWLQNEIGQREKEAARLTAETYAFREVLQRVTS